MAAMATAEFLTLGQTAAQLGIPKSTLQEMRHQHALFEPAVQGLPWAGGPDARGRRPGMRLTRFHRRQVELMEAAMVGAVDLETAWLTWEVFRRRIGSTDDAE